LPILTDRNTQESDAHINAYGGLAKPMSLQRMVRSELLDELAPSDPLAIEIRNDLRFMNSMLPSASIVARTLLENFPQGPPRALMEIGAGDGSFMLSVAKRLAPKWKNVTAVLLDQTRLVNEETQAAFSAIDWKLEIVEADAVEYMRQSKEMSSDAIVANLFLHHFQDDQLRGLFELITHATSLLVACEPRRSKLSLRVCQNLWVAGCNDVTSLDVTTSVWAGFRNRELPALWPARTDWDVRERFVWPFLQCLTARRTTQPGSATS
jgi:2-polyprenyl-3-methyl-5-hydroxy-6-metoxy-1,4-benzoquinol methylase